MDNYPIVLGREFDHIPDDPEELTLGPPTHSEAIFTAFDGLQLCAMRRDLPWFIGTRQILAVDNARPPMPQIMPDVYLYQTLTMNNPTIIPIAQHGPPALIIEVARPVITLASDLNLIAPQGMPYFYEQIGVTEYIAFDPTGEIFGVSIRAWHRSANGFEPWLPADDGHFYSALGISFAPIGNLLRVYDHEGQLVPTSREFAAMFTEEHHQLEEGRRAGAELNRRSAELEAENRRLRGEER